MASNRILVFRFSAMGDVAMCVPVVAQFCKQYPDIELIFVTRKHFKAMFPALPNLFIHPIEPQGKHKGFRGLYVLYKELKALQPTYIADLHENLRTRILKFFFLFSAIQIATLDKRRGARKRLVADKDLTPLSPVYKQYELVFNELGFDFEFSPSVFLTKRSISQDLLSFFPFLAKQERRSCVGIFPFAQHIQKVYPLHQMREVVQVLSAQDIDVFVFGAGEKERLEVDHWGNIGINVHNTIGRMSLELEMQLIANLDVLLSMDTAGMHMASLFGVRVVSVWGATHPSAGFLGIGQEMQDAVQIDLECRPCSIYGNKPCARGDLACMNGISPQKIADQVVKYISKEKS